MSTIQQRAASTGFLDDMTKGDTLDYRTVRQLIQEFASQVVLTRTQQVMGEMSAEQRNTELLEQARKLERTFYGDEDYAGNSWFSRRGLGMTLARGQEEDDPEEQVVRVLLDLAVDVTKIYDLILTSDNPTLVDNIGEAVSERVSLIFPVPVSFTDNQPE